MLHDFQDRLPDGVHIVPSSGGVFEISLGDEVVFSKKKAGRFPENSEIDEALEQRLDAA
ncbi:MAG: SelT/SelW/SelH family protein [Chloroflexia bacterium]|nr:SelT/SelW/SelH family protein [Chloroflexia bacterium]